MLCGAVVSVVGLAGCSEDAGTRLAAPELACLDRIDAALRAPGSYNLEDPNQAREGFAVLANVMDSVDLSGCSAQTIANYRAARGGVQRAQTLIAEYDRYGGSAQRLARMRAAASTMQNSFDAIGAERRQRRADFDRKRSER